MYSDLNRGGVELHTYLTLLHQTAPYLLPDNSIASSIQRKKKKKFQPSHASKTDSRSLPIPHPLHPLLYPLLPRLHNTTRSKPKRRSHPLPRSLFRRISSHRSLRSHHRLPQRSRSRAIPAILSQLRRFRRYTHGSRRRLDPKEKFAHRRGKRVSRRWDTRILGAGGARDGRVCGDGSGGEEWWNTILCSSLRLSSTGSNREKAQSDADGFGKISVGTRLTCDVESHHDHHPERPSRHGGGDLLGKYDAVAAIQPV